MRRAIHTDRLVIAAVATLAVASLAVVTGAADGPPPPAGALPAVADPVEIYREYLNRRWIVTQERPVVVLCGSLGALGSSRVLDSLKLLDSLMSPNKKNFYQEADCLRSTRSDYPGGGPVLRLRELIVDPVDTTKGLLHVSVDTRRSYYMRETMRFHRVHGGVVELIFSGFEEYHVLR